MRTLAASLAAMILAGCAAAPPANMQVASATPADGTRQQVCTKERRTGTDIATTVCTQVMSDADRSRLQDELYTFSHNRMNQAPGP